MKSIGLSRFEVPSPHIFIDLPASTQFLSVSKKNKSAPVILIASPENVRDVIFEIRVVPAREVLFMNQTTFELVPNVDPDEETFVYCREWKREYMYLVETSNTESLEDKNEH